MKPEIFTPEAFSTPDRLHAGQFAGADVALGRAVNLLSPIEPFSSYDFGSFSVVLTGQIRRRHYLFTLLNNQAAGYVGWAMCDEDAARAWVDRQSVPTFDQCIDGACWVGITLFAASQAVCLFQIRYLRNLYPGKKAFGIRDYGTRSRPGFAVNRVASPR